MWSRRSTTIYNLSFFFPDISLSPIMNQFYTSRQEKWYSWWVLKITRVRVILRDYPPIPSTAKNLEKLIPREVKEKTKKKIMVFLSVICPLINPSPKDLISKSWNHDNCKTRSGKKEHSSTGHVTSYKWLYGTEMCHLRSS